MNSQEIQDAVVAWAQGQNFTAPYGVLSGEHVNNKGRKFRSVTFGHARTLDATVEIYNRNFMVLRTNWHGSTVFRSWPQLQAHLPTLTQSRV